ASHGNNALFTLDNAGTALTVGATATNFLAGLTRNISRLNFYSCCTGNSSAAGDLLAALVPAGGRIGQACGSTREVDLQQRATRSILTLRVISVTMVPTIVNNTWVCRSRP